KSNRKRNRVMLSADPPEIKPNFREGKKPAPMPVIVENIPDELRQLHRWVCWRWEWDPEKYKGRGGWDKPLYNPRNGWHASSTNTRSWNDLATVLAAHRAGGYDGIGITLGDLGDGRTLGGVDLDHHRDPATGRIDDFATAIIRQLDSYAEVSPSATG